MYPPSTQYPEGSAVSPEWNEEQHELFINEVAKQSPLFERQLMRLFQDSQYEWKIQVKETDEFHDDDLDLGSFIPSLGRKSCQGMKINSLSRRCSALWHFQVLPSEVQLASSIIDDTGQKIITSIPPTLSTSSETTLTSASSSATPSETVSEDLGSERGSWCWDIKCDHPSRETSLKLANIALVLNLKDVFKKEIKTVIWNWPKESAADKNPTIPCLQKDNTLGVIGLKGE